MADNSGRLHRTDPLRILLYPLVQSKQEITPETTLPKWLENSQATKLVLISPLQAVCPDRPNRCQTRHQSEQDMGRSLIMSALVKEISSIGTGDDLRNGWRSAIEKKMTYSSACTSIGNRCSCAKTSILTWMH